MGTGKSSALKRGRGLGAVMRQDGGTVRCGEGGSVRALGKVTVGTGHLALSGESVVVVRGHDQLAVCDPDDPAAARLAYCLSKHYEYVAMVEVGSGGEPFVRFLPADAPRR